MHFFPTDSSTNWCLVILHGVCHQVKYEGQHAKAINSSLVSKPHRDSFGSQRRRHSCVTLLFLRGTAWLSRKRVFLQPRFSLPIMEGAAIGIVTSHRYAFIFAGSSPSSEQLSVAFSRRRGEHAQIYSVLKVDEVVHSHISDCIVA